MLEKFKPIKLAKRSYWLNAFLTNSKSILTENVLNQWKIIKKFYILGVTTAILLRYYLKTWGIASLGSFSLS